MKRRRVRFEAMRQIYPGWARQYEGVAESWLNLSLWLRWVLAAVGLVLLAIFQP